jgi:hypothetical protein
MNTSPFERSAGKAVTECPERFRDSKKSERHRLNRKNVR